LGASKANTRRCASGGAAVRSCSTARSQSAMPSRSKVASISVLVCVVRAMSMR
jgi:hypothetical protein